jgi:hypothetical protein
MRIYPDSMRRCRRNNYAADEALRDAQASKKGKQLAINDDSQTLSRQLLRRAWRERLDTINLRRDSGQLRGSELSEPQELNRSCVEMSRYRSTDSSAFRDTSVLDRACSSARACRRPTPASALEATVSTEGN